MSSLDQLLQGTAAGVSVTQASSAPGGGISIRVRGASSISGNSEPLYLVDGFPIENDPDAASPGNGGRATASVPSNPLASLNPQDIESLQVLKDASATAIYGARIEQYSTNAARAVWNRPRPAGCGNCIARDSSVPKVTLSLTDRDRFYPIPQAAIDSNPLLTQNPGY